MLFDGVLKDFVPPDPKPDREGFEDERNFRTAMERWKSRHPSYHDPSDDAETEEAMARLRRKFEQLGPV